MSRASLLWAIVRIAWWIRPPPSRRWASTLAPSSGPSRWSSGNAHVVVDDVVWLRGSGLISTPGVFRGTTNMPFVHITKRMSATRPVDCEPLLTVDDPLVPVADCVSLEQARVRPALRLGHRVGREHVLVQQRHEPPLLLLLGPVGGEHLHVPGVGCSGAENLRRRGVAADHLVQQRQLQLAEPGTAELLVEEDRPEPLLLDLLLERADVGLHHGVG